MWDGTKDFRSAALACVPNCILTTNRRDVLVGSPGGSFTLAEGDCENCLRLDGRSNSLQPLWIKVNSHGFKLFHPQIKASGSDDVTGEINKIRGGAYTSMPPMQTSRTPLGGNSRVAIMNGTNDTLFVYFVGTTTQKLEIMPNAVGIATLSPGSYEVAAKVSDSRVTPFYGKDNYGENIQYSSQFYIRPSIH
jgi:hypothetical protein